MPLIHAANLRKTYRLGRIDVPVLRGVELRVEPGEFVAVLGASGSGKSTLLHLLGGLDRPDRDSGSVIFEGTALNSMNSARLDAYRTGSVGFVFQFYHLLPELSVLENVLLGAMVKHGRFGFSSRRGAITDSAKALLDAVGLSHRLRHRPVELSGGERQRVAIARALINDPALLLADEPTGNLDRATGAKILEMLLQLRGEKKRTMVIVTHDPETAALADRIVQLTDGRIASA